MLDGEAGEAFAVGVSAAFDLRNRGVIGVEGEKDSGPRARTGAYQRSVAERHRSDTYGSKSANDRHIKIAMSQKDHSVTGRQIAAARTLLTMGQVELAASASISVPTLKRMEAREGPAAGMTNNVRAVVAALEAAGLEFIPENGGGAGIRFRQPGSKMA